MNLCKNGRCKCFCIHTLVLTAFFGPCPPGLECCHGDGERTNNHLGNLRWDTRSANHLDAIAHGTWMPPVLQGDAHGSAKLTEVDVIEIRRAYTAGGISQAALGAQFDVAGKTISRIIRRENWAHVGA